MIGEVMTRAREVLSEYQATLTRLEHDVEAFERIISKLNDTTITIGMSLADPEVDRILRMICDFEEMKTKCLDNIEEVSSSYLSATEAIDKLAHNHAWVLTAHFLEGMSIRSIARQESISTRKVYRMLDDALAELDKKLGYIKGA
jgi:DNA-directed RNA polymerase specialized sigma24 family protein